jgi:sulfur carrier protein
MDLTVNGEVKQVSCVTVSDLLIVLGIESRQVAVELNLGIVPRDMYESTILNAGDSIEIVHFVGGG